MRLRAKLFALGIYFAKLVNRQISSKRANFIKSQWDPLLSSGSRRQLRDKLGDWRGLGWVMPRRAAFPARYICQEASILYLILDCVRGFDALLYRHAIPQEIWIASRLFMDFRNILYAAELHIFRALYEILLPRNTDEFPFNYAQS